jgi:glycosyltransferase involved in cell wall biosynthesis
MCNYLHENFKPIKKTGFGYKIFTYEPSSRNYFKPMFQDGAESFKSKEINKWNSKKFKNRGDGFCFFLTERVAKKFLLFYHHSSKIRTIRKIKYRKGLGKCTHRSGTYSICKEFKILEEV